MIITVKILLNRIPFDIAKNIQEVFDYNKGHGVELHFDIEHIDVHGYVSVYTQVRPNWSQYILTGAERIVPLQTHDITLFGFDMNEWKTTPGSKFPLKPEAPSADCILWNYKPFINLGLYLPDQENGINTNTFCHELMHAYRMMANMKSMPIQDVMDTYFHNEDRNFPTGNFAQQWGLLAPFIHPVNTYAVLKIGSKGDAVKELQTDLDLLAYKVGIVDGEFGPKTAKGVMEFQKSHSLIADGIVGKNTWARIKDLIPKKKS